MKDDRVYLRHILRCIARIEDSLANVRFKGLSIRAEFEGPHNKAQNTLLTST